MNIFRIKKKKTRARIKSDYSAESPPIGGSKLGAALASPPRRFTRLMPSGRVSVGKQPLLAALNLKPPALPGDTYFVPSGEVVFWEPRLGVTIAKPRL